MSFNYINNELITNLETTVLIWLGLYHLLLFLKSIVIDIQNTIVGVVLQINVGFINSQALFCKLFSGFAVLFQLLNLLRNKTYKEILNLQYKHDGIFDSNLKRYLDQSSILLFCLCSSMPISCWHKFMSVIGSQLSQLSVLV